jgi:zeta-carotene desaturase
VTPPLRHPVVIIGAGLAGLAAAVRLASRRVPVLLLERRPGAGGRAWSFTDRGTGETVDNGQHLLIAGYAATFRFLRTIGSDHLLTIQRRPGLHLHHPDRGFGTLRLPPLPSPLHLAAGVLGFPLLPRSDRISLLRAGAALRRITPRDAARLDSYTIAAWLDTQEQSAEVRRTFWEPLAVSILNETPARGSAWPFLHALRVAFLGSVRGAALAAPSAGLSRLFAEPARTYLTRRGAVLRTSAGVTALELSGDRVAGVVLDSGERVPAGAVVLAVPWHDAARLLPELSGVLPSEASPIVSVHLWFPRDDMPHPITGLVGRRVQWVFNRRLLLQDGRPGGHVSAVISGAHREAALDQDALVRLAVDDLRSAYPAFPASPSAALVIREKRATPSFLPGTDRLRPPAETGYRNLFLAGDWTATGLPATLEGAVLSGERAAACIAGQESPGG